MPVFDIIITKEDDSDFIAAVCQSAENLKGLINQFSLAKRRFDNNFDNLFVNLDELRKDPSKSLASDVFLSWNQLFQMAQQLENHWFYSLFYFSLTAELKTFINNEVNWPVTIWGKQQTEIMKIITTKQMTLNPTLTDADLAKNNKEINKPLENIAAYLQGYLDKEPRYFPKELHAFISKINKPDNNAPHNVVALVAELKTSVANLNPSFWSKVKAFFGYGFKTKGVSDFLNAPEFSQPALIQQHLTYYAAENGRLDKAIIEDELSFLEQCDDDFDASEGYSAIELYAGVRKNEDANATSENNDNLDANDKELSTNDDELSIDDELPSPRVIEYSHGTNPHLLCLGNKSSEVISSLLPNSDEEMDEYPSVKPLTPKIT